MIRLVRLLLAGLLVLMPALVPGVAYANDEQAATITIDQFDPAVPARESTITIRGRVTNTSGETLTLAQVLMWRDWSPVTTAEGLAATLTSAPTQPYGGRVTEPGAFQNLTTDAKPSLAPGETVPFQVQAAVSQLELPRTGGVYLMGVHVVGKAGRRGNATLGRARVLVPLPRQGTAAAQTDQVRVPTVVVLSSAPSMVAPGVFSDDHLADELAANGRLSRLMRAAARPDVSWAIDPALLESVRAMATESGYQVRQTDGATFPGTGSAMARRWLADYESLQGQRGFRTPFAVPDMATIAHQGLEESFRRVQAAGEQVSETSSLPLLGYVREGQVDAETVAWLERLEPAVILASDTTTSQSYLTPLTTAPLLAYDPNAYAGGPGPEPRLTSVHVRQRVLADTWVAAAAHAAPQVHVVTEGAEADADIAADAPWIKRMPLTDLLREKPAEWNQQLGYTTQMRDRELDPAQLDQMRQVSRAQAAYAEILPDPVPRQRLTNSLIARTLSSWWRGDPAAYRTWVEPLLAESRDLLGGAKINLTSQRTVIMSGQSGSFPMTVTNKLDHPVRVAIDFTSDQPQRLSFARHNDIVVPAQQSTTVNVTGRAAANGPVMVTAQLVTPDGTRIGRGRRLEVRATNFGFVGWIIVVASGVVLISTTAFRIRQVARERVASIAARRVTTSDAPQDDEQEEGSQE
ncbi:hypothetical protein GCM10027418_04420 [Mariniluteicoccus endophyticus]